MASESKTAPVSTPSSPPVVVGTAPSVATVAPLSAVSPLSPTRPTRSVWKVWSQPLKVLVLILGLTALLATLSWADWRPNVDEWITAVAKLGMLFLGAWVAMRALLLVGVKPSQRWEHRIITCLILFLLFAPDAPWWGFLLLGAVTETLQRVLRLPTGPVANPAALGTLAVAWAFGAWGVLPTWWGVSFSPRVYLVSEGLSVASLVLVPVLIWVAWKYKKLWTAAALLGASALAYALVYGVSPAYLVFEGTLFFFALVMAVEPKTSPVLRNEQILFGAGVGVLMVLLLKIYFVEAYTGALVVGNLMYNGWRWWKLQRMRARVPLAKKVAVESA